MTQPHARAKGPFPPPPTPESKVPAFDRVGNRGTPPQPTKPGTGSQIAGSLTVNAPITIDGANQSPEELADAIQRRIAETINWRTHDVDSDVG